MSITVSVIDSYGGIPVGVTATISDSNGVLDSQIIDASGNAILTWPEDSDSSFSLVV